jgi:nitroreductase
MSLTVEEAARSRVSIRRYTNQPISDAEILEILEVAGKAPSAWNVEPWRFIAVTNDELKQRLKEAAYGQPQVGAATVLFVVTSDMEAALSKIDDWLHPGLPAERKAEERASILATFDKMGLEGRASWGRNQTNIALGYLLLTLKSKGLGSSPMLGFDPAKVREILGLADHVEIPALVAVGYPAEDGFPQHRLPVSDVATILS